MNMVPQQPRPTPLARVLALAASLKGAFRHTTNSALAARAIAARRQAPIVVVAGDSLAARIAKESGNYVEVYPVPDNDWAATAYTYRPEQHSWWPTTSAHRSTRDLALRDLASRMGMRI